MKHFNTNNISVLRCLMLYKVFKLSFLIILLLLPEIMLFAVADV